MATQQTMLQLLQTRTVVDCDTMDIDGLDDTYVVSGLRKLSLQITVPKALGPFVDCTSNQVIGFLPSIQEIG